MAGSFHSVYFSLRLEENRPHNDTYEDRRRQLDFKQNVVEAVEPCIPVLWIRGRFNDAIQVLSELVAVYAKTLCLDTICKVLDNRNEMSIQDIFEERFTKQNHRFLEFCILLLNI